jgi:hypothetical protein
MGSAGRVEVMMAPIKTSTGDYPKIFRAERACLILMRSLPPLDDEAPHDAAEIAALIGKQPVI